MALHYDYPTIEHRDPDARIASGFGVSLPTLGRPAAALMLGGLAFIVDQPVLVATYAYLASLQLCILFAALFVLRNVIDLSHGLSLFLALGVTVGFVLQYSFDINSWSALAALPLLTLYAGLFILGLAANASAGTTQVAPGVLGNVGFFCSMLVCIAGFWYIYPEMLSLVGAISAPIVLYQFFVSGNRAYLFRRLILLALAAGGATALCAFAWPMTAGFVLEQARFLADPVNVAEMAGWWKITHRHFFAVDTDPSTAFNFIGRWHRSFSGFMYHVLSIITSFLAGIMGVYFLQPGSIWLLPDQIPIGFRVAWELALLAALAGILGFWLLGLLRTSGEPRQRMQRALFVGVLGGLALIGGLISVGQPYPAGKALTWLSPTLILALIGSLLADKRSPNIIKAVALSYIGFQIFFGGYRSYAAGHGAYGIHYRFPYTLDIGRKLFYRWDYAGLQAALWGCSRVTVDLDDPFHEHFVEMVLADMGIRWSSRQPVWGYDRRGRDGIQKQVDNPDCAVTTRVRSIQPNHSVIWLRRDDRVLRFYRGETNRLDLVPNIPLELETEGLDAEEARVAGEASTNGHAVIRVPNNPQASARRLTFIVNSERLPADMNVAVLINGRRVLAGVVSRSSESTNWTRTVDLPDFGTAPWLTIEVDSDTHVLPGDTRALGAQLRLLSLER